MGIPSCLGYPTTEVILSFDFTSSLWAIDKNGSNLRQLPGSYRGLDFPWWMDPRTVVVTSYIGGGGEVISEIDYLTGKVLIEDLLHNYPRPERKENICLS
jgi:hypothetical protein